MMEEIVKRSISNQGFARAVGRKRVLRLACVVAIASALGFAPLPSSAAETDGGKIAAALGKSGTQMPGGVYRVGLPRTDLHVMLDGIKLKPTWRPAPGWLSARTATPPW